MSTTAEEELLDKNDVIAETKEELRLAYLDLAYFQNMANRAGKERTDIIQRYEIHVDKLQKSLSNAEGTSLGLGIVAILEFFIIIYLFTVA